jgi:hypothetical protein
VLGARKDETKVYSNVDGEEAKECRKVKQVDEVATGGRVRKATGIGARKTPQFLVHCAKYPRVVTVSKTMNHVLCSAVNRYIRFNGVRFYVFSFSAHEPKAAHSRPRNGMGVERIILPLDSGEFKTYFLSSEADWADFRLVHQQNLRQAPQSPSIEMLLALGLPA